VGAERDNPVEVEVLCEGSVKTKSTLRLGRTLTRRGRGR
jgi:hypothetical protein